MDYLCLDQNATHKDFQHTQMPETMQPKERKMDDAVLPASFRRLFVTASWGHVLAYDARTGALLWHFDPQVDKAYAAHTCCDVVNRVLPVGVKSIKSSVVWKQRKIRGKLRKQQHDMTSNMKFDNACKNVELKIQS